MKNFKENILYSKTKGKEKRFALLLGFIFNLSTFGKAELKIILHETIFTKGAFSGKRCFL